MKNDIYLKLLLTLILVNTTVLLKSQVPTCGSNVPFFQVNLTGNPNGVWLSPTHQRLGNCCGTTAPDNCTSFEVTLDSATVMIEFDIVAGAIPSGAMYYQINCGPQVAVGSAICLSGVGPHHITFCKPGNNENVYMIKAISAPLLPSPLHSRIGCTTPISIAGVDTASITWTSIYPGTPGQYNSYLSCTSGCANPMFTADANAPAYIDYLVAGTPIATSCGYFSFTDTVRIYVHESLQGSVTPNPASFCVENGGVTLTASGMYGYGQYSYVWHDTTTAVVGNGPSFFAPSAGLYSVEIMDELYSPGTCPATIISVPVTETSLPVANAGIDQSACFTNPAVSLNATVQNASGGTWSGGSGSFTPNNNTLSASYIPTPAELAAGSVTLTLTTTGATGGCSNKSDQVIITFPPAISLTANLSDYNGSNVSCNGASDGSIDLTPTGGTAPYSYTWSGGTTSEDLYDLSAGAYSVLVTDANGCTATLTQTINEPSKLIASAVSAGDYEAYDISCNGFNDGSIDLTVSGGTAGYTYLWSNAETSEDIIKLSGGIYSVTILDQNGCKTTVSITLSEPPPLSATALPLDDYNGFQIRCNGMNDAAIDLTVSGGVSGYIFSWSNGVTTEDLSALGTGTYSVTITDRNNCTAIASVLISEPPALVSTIVPSNYNGSNISCAGLSDGSVNVTVSGGVPTYLYSWTNGATTEDQINLGAGTYSVSITDANGCTEIHTVLLSEPPALSASALATTNFTGYQISCAGSSDANIDLTASGGTGPYFYSWSNNATTQDLTGLPAGQYSVTVTDQNNCSTTTSILLSEPPAILSTLDLGIVYNGYGVSCFGMSDGALDLQVNGGTGTYTYIWNNGSTSEDLNGIPAGTYSVVVTDENNCSSTAVLSLIEPAELSSAINTISLYNIYNVSCKGSTDGAIDAMVTGGVSAYTYTWSNGSTTEDLNSLGAGSYSLTVMDANNCVANIDVTLVEPSDVITSGNTSDYNGYSVSCFGSSDGAIDLSVSGGTGVYSYVWSNGSSDEDVAALAAGTFSVIVTDANTCSDTLVFNLSQPDSVQITAEIVNVTCNGFTNGSIDLTVNGGVSNYTYSWSTHVNSEDLTDLTSGTYTVTIKDMNNCVKEQVYAVQEASPLIVDINVTNANCAGETGSASINVTGGTPGYQYQWSHGGNSSIEQGLEPGTYEIFITDQNKCSVIKNIAITEPQVLTLDVSAQVYANGFNISNFGAADGVIKTAIAGGTAPYNFTWSNGSTTTDLTNVGAGLYVLQVTDSNGCALLDSAALNEPFALSMPTGYSPNGDGNNDYFVVRGIENYPDNELFIYNRWGNLVFDQEDYQNTWNGKANSGSDLPEGTYFVILKLTNGPTLSGYVDLRR